MLGQGSTSTSPPPPPHFTHPPQPQKAQKKMLDVINSVGLSGSMLKVIERRHKADTYLALGSMVRLGRVHTGARTWHCAPAVVCPCTGPTPMGAAHGCTPPLQEGLSGCGKIHGLPISCSKFICTRLFAVVLLEVLYLSRDRTPSCNCMFCCCRRWWLC